MPGCLFVRSFFDVTEHNHDAMSFRQPVDLLMNDVGRVVRHVAVGPSSGQLGRVLLGRLAALLLAFGLDGRAEGDTMEPGPDGVANPE